METQEQARFEGFAIVEIMGHRTIAGYVTTKYFGAAAMVHITQPDVPEQEQTLEHARYINGEWCEPGTKIRISREKAEAYVGAGSIYQLTPCTEKAALERQPEKIEIIEKVGRKALHAPATLADDEEAEEKDDEEAYMDEMEARQ